LQASDWSPDGKWLLVTTTAKGKETIWTISRNGRRRNRLFEREATQVFNAPHFTPHGNGVLYLRSHSDEKDLVLLPVADGDVAGAGRTLIEGMAAEEFSISRDGRQLAYTRARGAGHFWRVTIYNPEAARPEVHAQRLLTDSAPKSDAEISPA